MWRLLPALIFCGTLAFGADVCGGIPGVPAFPSGSSHAYDTPRTISYQLSVKPGGPAFLITVRPLPVEWQRSSDFLLHAGDIEVARCPDGQLLQTLPVMAWQPINFAATLAAYDIDFDGYTDLSVLAEYASKFGSYWWWVYDPGSQRFVENELTGALRKETAFQFEMNRERQEITITHLAGVGQCGLLPTRYRVENRRLVLIHKEEINQDVTGPVCSVTVWDLIGGALRVSGVQEMVDGHPKK